MVAATRGGGLRPAPFAITNENRYHLAIPGRNRPMTRFALAALICALAAPALAAEPVEIKLAIQDHKFEPAELKVPAGQKIKLLVENRDDTAEEFESHELNREKIVGPKATITVYIGPLEPGRYPFFGEFHMDTAQGVVVAE